LFTATTASAEQNTAELATKLANPVASLISFPFQFNGDCCYGPADSGRLTLNIQPVVPLALNPEWNLIVRTIVPVIDQQETFTGQGDDFGLGDTTQRFFFSPNPASGGIIWALGPVFLWPTGTDTTLSARKWGAGPTALVLKQQSGWTYGVLANHIWSYAGESGQVDLSNTFLQPFIGYTWPDSTGITLDSESTYSWEAGQWIVPLNLVLSHVFTFGSQPVSFQFGAPRGQQRKLGRAARDRFPVSRITEEEPCPLRGQNARCTRRWQRHRWRQELSPLPRWKAA
jgi:hypothetical protein